MRACVADCLNLLAFDNDDFAEMERTRWVEREGQPVPKNLLVFIAGPMSAPDELDQDDDADG